MLEKVNRKKEIRGREKNGLKITDSSLMGGRKCHESKVCGEGEGL